jgi:hypothetical protein
LSWSLILGNFFVYCFADAPPTYIDLKGKHITGKSFSEALILASTNPKYDKKIVH